MKYTEITAYQCTDDSIFANADDAGSHQYELNLRKDLARMVSDFYSHSLTQSDIVDALWQLRFGLLKAILDNEDVCIQWLVELAGLLNKTTDPIEQGELVKPHLMDLPTGIPPAMALVLADMLNPLLKEPYDEHK